MSSRNVVIWTIALPLFMWGPVSYHRIWLGENIVSKSGHMLNDVINIWPLLSRHEVA